VFCYIVYSVEACMGPFFGSGPARYNFGPAQTRPNLLFGNIGPVRANPAILKPDPARNWCLKNWVPNWV